MSETTTAAARRAEINSIAAVQEGLITRQQLLAAGMSSDAIQRRQTNGTFKQIHRGVYRIGPLVGAFAPLRAALLACGGGAISHHSAAILLDLLPPSRGRECIDVTIADHRRSVRPGIRAHPHALIKEDIMRRHDMAVTTPARTLFDLASEGSVDIARAFAKADHDQPDLRANLADILRRYRRSRGSGVLRALMHDETAGTFTRSEAEDRLVRLIKSGGLPWPETNVRVAGYEVDCYWRRARLVAEVDGYEFHGSKRAFVRDRQRDSALAAVGVAVIRLSWHQLTAERDRTLVELASALARSEMT